MPINTDLNVSPYFDDFDANNQYYRILFRPSVAVQARELTQAQSILQNQIESFGNWTFKNGDVVSGCSVTDDPVLPFVRLQDFQTNSASYNIESFANLQAVSQTSNLTATIVTVTAGVESNYPNTNVLYLSYKNSGDNGEKVFSNNETLVFYNIPRTGNDEIDIVATINTYANSATNQITVGNAHGIHVDGGIVYLNGNFVKVLTPTYGLVNNFGTYAANTVVGFQLIENIITENQDPTLLDNALGYSNENAPGAHRLQLKPTLVALDPVTAQNTAGFNPIAVYNYGSLVSKTTASQNVYSIIGDVMAKRTFEESGNYVVNPFSVDTVTNVPGDSIVASMDANSVLGRINPGAGYAQGNRVELQKTSYINMRRGIDVQTNLEQQITFNYGGYFILNEVAGSFAFDKAQLVTLYDTPQKAVTTRKYNTLTPTGNIVGTAMMKSFAYNSASPDNTTTLYTLHVFNIKMNPGYNTNQIQSVYYNGSVKGVGDLYQPGLQKSASKSQLYSFGVTGLKNLRDSGNNVNTEYVYRTKTSTSMGTNGDLTITITSSAPGGTDILPYGIGQLPDIDAITFSLIATSNVDSAALSGTVNVSSTSTSVLGNSTTFTTNYNPKDTIKVGSDIRTIVSITNATSMTVDAPFSGSANLQAYYKSYISGKIIPISSASNGPTSYIQVTNSTSFSINTNEIPSSTLSVDVVFDVLRTNTVPAKKVINKNRFVKLDTTTSPNGPWCLGVSDIHQITAIYGSNDGSYTVANPDVTKNFVFDTGQKDTHYDLGYLYPVSGYTTKNNPYLLVQLDYFTANTAAGVGFFTVESYPIDDANTANTTAIQSKDIPLYVTESGKRTPLRDFVDFRTPSVSTANNTGAVDMANSANITTAISYATVNPSSTLTLAVPAAGLNIPSYGRNMQSDYTFYLPRKDLIYITPDNNIKVKEGLSSLSPQAPLYPDNAMAVAILEIPPYPSLSTDQLDGFLPVNQLSTSVIRDTSLGIKTNNVTNRRYTMRDIGKLDSRITNLEYYTSLSLLEKKATDMSVTDANGLDRFKNGIFVDSFNDFTQSDVSNPEYSIAIDTSKGQARPRIVREIVNIEFDNVSSTNVQKTGRLVTLPYTETPFMVQPYSTKYRSSAHVSMAWNGTCILIPAYDNNSDINNTGSISITVDATTPWKDFAKSPFGSIWGDWVTTTNVVSTTVTTESGVGNLGVVDLGHFIGGTNYENALALAKNIIHQKYGDNVTVGQYNITWSDVRLKKDITLIGKLLNGLNLYKYRYLWSDIFYVGVMAQEVANIIPDAVVYDNSGYMKVNYDKVGTPFMTWSQWLNTKEISV